MKRLNNCLEGKNYDNFPVWFMRQAGRYLPEFQEIRKKNKNFIDLCLNEKLCTEISLQPLSRYDLDAAIIFSDILMIPYGLGQNVDFKKNFGPQLDKLIMDEVISKNHIDFIKNVNPIYKAIKKLKKNVGKNKSVIGFVGAPWTLLVYMIGQKSPKKNINIEALTDDKNLIDKLLKKLEEIICLHIKKQIESGADVIQIFDSWAGILPEKKLPKYCYEPTLKIVEYIKSKKIPTICFPKGIKKNYIDFCSTVKPDCISIDCEIDPIWAKKKMKGTVIQGGLDPKVLLENKENIKKKVEQYLNIFIDYPYVFNLGHGVLPNTKPEIIDYVIGIVRNKKK